MINRTYITQLRDSECRIAQMDYKERSKMVGSIPAMMKMIGCNIDPEENDDSKIMVMETLNKLILESYGMTLTPGEFKYAFQLYISGDVTVPKEFQHYGQFNLKFITELINNYIEKRTQLLRSVPPQRMDAEKQLAGKHPFDECMENYIFMMEAIKQGGQLPLFGNFDYCFLFLKVIDVINPTKEEYQDHIGIVRMQISEEADRYQSPEERRDYRKQFENPDAFKTKCRDEYFKRWVQERFTDFMDENGELNQAELSKWIDSEIESVKSRNQSGEFNKYRK